MNNKALNGVTVLDLTRVLAGPYASMMLADMGANVIKIERPETGDDTRSFEPTINGESAYYLNLNRNKKGMTLDLNNPLGKKLFLELVEKADIVLENYRPGVMDRFGLGYEVLKKRNPSIIYGCVSGFGHYGPYTERPGYDIIAQAMGGLMSTTGWPDGLPTRSGTAIADVLGGMSLAIGILAAYIHCKNTGVGQKVDIALVDSVVSGLEIINQIYLATGREPGRNGNRYESSYPYDSFMAKDGLLVIGAGNDKLYEKLCNLMEKSELFEDSRFASNSLRLANYKLLSEIIEKWLADYTVEEAVQKMLDAGVPASPIYTISQVVNDTHIADIREMFVEMEHPNAGKFKVTGNQIKMSETPVHFHRAAPLLGQDTELILKELLGINGDKYLELKNKNIF